MLSGISFIQSYFRIFRLTASSCLRFDSNGGVHASKWSLVTVVPVLIFVMYNSLTTVIQAYRSDHTYAFTIILAILPPVILSVLLTVGQFAKLRSFSEALRSIAVCDKYLKLPLSILFYPLAETFAFVLQNSIAVLGVFVIAQADSDEDQNEYPIVVESSNEDGFDQIINLLLSYWEPVKIVLCMMLDWSFIFSSSIQYTCFVNTIGHYFAQLNRKLQQNNLDIDGCLRCYHSLIYASQVLDECFGPIMLVVFGSCFALIGHAMVVVMKEGVQIYSDNVGYHIARMIPALIILFLLPLYVAHICEKTSNQAGLFTEILNDLALSESGNHLTKNTFVNLHCSSYTPLKFTACQCFVINYHLAYKIALSFGAACAYAFSNTKNQLIEAVHALGGDTDSGAIFNDTSNSTFWDTFGLDDSPIDLDILPL